MSMRCELTGKSFQTGNNVSHAKNRTKRRFKPNLQNITFVSEVLGQKFQLKVAVSTIRTVEKKGGLDEFLMNTPNSKLPLKAKKIAVLRKEPHLSWSTRRYPCFLFLNSNNIICCIKN